ncbi:MAG: cellulase family glycosylhydrolase [Salinivirgaceae bacterium]
MKKQLIVTAILNLIFFVSFAQPVLKFGQLKVSGTQLCDSADKPVTLRGMSFGWHNWWPRFYNTEAVNWLVNDWKVDAVRAAMGVEPYGGYLTDSATAVQKIKAVVDAAIDKNIYVIIDWHSHGLLENEAKAFFKLMAETYGDYPHVIYEIYNEPDDNYTWEQVKAYAIEVIKTIRAIDSDNIILVGSPHWDQDLHLVAADPITGYQNLMYTMHFYAGTHGSWLRDRCDAAIQAGIPIFVSESAACLATGDGPLDYESWNEYLQWMEQNRISWFCWSIADKNETSAALYPSASSTGEWQQADLKEWGQYIRGLFQKYYFSYEPARIFKAMEKGRQGQDLKIGVIGGSITAGHAASSESKRWANLVTNWWKTTFPNSNVQLINAGWGGTGSDIGAHRVYDDLLAANPDFIVIEFAVNDSEGPHATKMMEGLVQQIIKQENAPGIMILTLKQENGTTAQKSHKAVAAYYNIPVVSFTDLIDAQVAEDGITLSSIFVDGLHPNDAGMAYIAQFINQQLDSLYQELPATVNLPPVNTNLPVPLVSNTYANTFQFFSDNIIPLHNQGWETTDAGWISDTPGHQIDFKVMGNAFSVVFTQNNSDQRGKAELWVDEGEKIVIDAYMNEDWGTRYAFALIEEGLSDGEHTVHIRSVAETSTQGHFVQISRLLVAGKIGSAAPIAITSGYQKGLINSALELDGTGSFDPDGEEIESYLWNIEEKPEGSSVLINSPEQAKANFTTDVAGTYLVSLTVGSGFNQSVPAYKTLDIRAFNNKPVAVAGNDTMSATNKYFKLNASASYDADNDPLSYQWKLESAPETSTAELMGTNLVRPQIRFTVEGNYTFSLLVFDSIEYSDKVFVSVVAKEGYTSISSTHKNETIRVYPSPTKGTVLIDFDSVVNERVQIEMYSILGSRIGSFEIPPALHEIQSWSINLRQFTQEPGIYFIRVIHKGQGFTQRITLL